MTSKPRSRRLVIGAMTGTSLDGIDVAAAGIKGTGLEMRAKLLHHVTSDLGPVRDDLRRAAQREPMTAERFAQLALTLGQRYAEAIDAVVQSGEPIDLIAVHGQTIVHHPPISWQLINPAPIATRFRCPVVYDFRQADLAAGGQGAPITPIADWVLFGDSPRRRSIVNLGGFCNVTTLPCADDNDPLKAIRGFDVCVCNQVLDAVARQALGCEYDNQGRAAAAGSADDEAIEALHVILHRQRSQHRSLGSADEAWAWVTQHKTLLRPNDLIASAVEAVARCIGEALAEYDADEIILAGGGAHNRALVEAINRHGHTPIRLSDALGIPIQTREALAMAVLGALCADGIPITLPQVTGCTAPPPVAGTWCLPHGLAWAPR